MPPWPDRLRLEGWIIDYDAVATARAYEAARLGRHVCQCAYCRNYRIAREAQQPARLRALLRQVGVDPSMETEVAELGETRGGKRLYSGWYTFAGELLAGPDGRMIVIAADDHDHAAWHLFFRTGRSLAFESFGELPLVQLEFQTELPWLIEDSPFE